MTLFHDRMLAAYHAGVLTDIPLANSFAVQPALLYTVKGTKTIDAFTTGMGNTSGFPDLSASDRTLEKHRYFGVSVGYLFTRK